MLMANFNILKLMLDNFKIYYIILLRYKRYFRKFKLFVSLEVHMYQNIFNADDTRLRNLPLEYGYAQHQHVGLAQLNLADQARIWAGEALVNLGTWIKPESQKSQGRQQTTAWQGR